MRIRSHELTLMWGGDLKKRRSSVSPDLQRTSRRLTLPFEMLRLLLTTLLVTASHAENRTGAAIATAARTQIGVTTSYDPAYVALAYPGGDLPMDRGVCTDVVIRALRKALKADLQALVHEDMRARFGKYPKNWGLARPDRNIDHRRVPNLQTYLKLRGFSLPVGKDAADYLPGDLVTCTVPPHLPHIMIVSDQKSAAGTPLIIHNIGRGTVEEDRLFEFPLTGHYRWKKAP